MKLDSAHPAGKFRAKAAAALDGQAGVWGDADMICVDFDAAGDLILAAAVGDAKGVIITTEGRNSATTDYNDVIGGRDYTVFTFAEFAEVAAGASTLDVGDTVYASTNGNVTVGVPATGAVYIGQVLSKEILVVNVNGSPAAA